MRAPDLPLPLALPTAPARPLRALGGHDYRLWAGGALISNVGTWMQRTAQDWLVLTELTRHSGTAVGVVTALQFAPIVLLLPLTGLAADRFDRRRLLLVTQAALALLAAALGLLAVSGRVQLWQVNGFALALGVVAAFDAPARQSFVGELVAEADLASAVALNSISFNAARMLGPALAGLAIARVGCGWVFVANAASYLAVIGSLGLLRPATGRPATGRPATGRPPRGRDPLWAGLVYLRGRPELGAILAMLAWVGTFGLHFPIFIATMAVRVFGADAGAYGLLTAAMAAGAVAGAVLTARRPQPRPADLVRSAALFAVGALLAALAPAAWAFAAAMVGVGVAAQTLTTSATSLVQLGCAPEMRGRVLAILLAITAGGTPLGAPLVGWVADAWGPRWALGVAAAAGMVAAAVGHRRLRLRPAGP